MLFACLQSQAVSRMSISIFRDTDDTSRNSTFVFVFCCKISSRRTTVEHRNTEALAAAEHYVGSPFARRCQQYQTHQVGCYGYTGFVGVRFCNKFFIIFNRTIRIRELYDSSEYIRCKDECLIISYYHVDTLWNHACFDYG